MQETSKILQKTVFYKQFNSIQQTFYYLFLILDTYMFKSGTAANYLDIF